jgi:hypothetical protein
MNTITRQKIKAKLLRLAQIAKDRNDPPKDCSVDENDFWVTHYADYPDWDEDYVPEDYVYVGGGTWMWF